MQAIPSLVPAQAEGETPRALKRVARQLFAERGIRAVSVREIAAAAGQRNMGAVAYHFATKDRLISEILIDGAKRIESHRAEMLARMEAENGPKAVEDAVSAIVLPSVEFADNDTEFGQCFNRFLFRITQYDLGFVDRVLEGRHNACYQRCLVHLRRLLPEIPTEVQNRRFVFMGTYLSSLLAQREAMFADQEAEHRHWRSPEMLQDIIRTASAILKA